jgi:preprotein translocase subunit SecD
MPKKLRLKFFTIVAVPLICVLGIIGLPGTFNQLKENLRERIRLGLDLRGGMHLILQVNTEDALNIETDLLVERIKRALEDEEISFEDIRRRDITHVEILDVESTKVRDVRALITESYSAWDIVNLFNPPNSFLLTLRPTVVSQIRESSVREAIQRIRNRVDELGVTEPVIQNHGPVNEYQILVQLPGVDDSARVREIIKSTALLELKIVEPADVFVSRADALKQYNGVVPSGKQLLQGISQFSDSSQPSQTWYVANQSAAITGKDLRMARAQADEFGRPAVGFDLTNDGASRFERITADNVGKRLAIVLDGRVQSAPNIQESIRSSGQITGSFSDQEANDLALVLRSGALPASMDYLEERTVGASLGVDSIRQGVIASLIALVGVALFMVIYYKLSGIIAITALVLNLIILLAAMVYIGATLTLPGIAGVVLLIGMAVDSNVLIFERIKEEIWSGKTISSSVSTGFGKAIITIVDANVTTVVAVLFLFLFGTGPVKGFAVVLFWGLLANLFTAIFVSRFIFEVIVGRNRRRESLSI